MTKQIKHKRFMRNKKFKKKGSSYVAGSKKNKKETRFRENELGIKLKVSAIVLTYNDENCIEETLTSIVSQSYPNLEIIVIHLIHLKICLSHAILLTKIMVG